MRARTSISLPARQRGAALIIGLLLLLVLTVLAVTGMNSASTELVMAGNEQYRQDAFRAAEVGIEQIMLQRARFNPDPAVGTFSVNGVTNGTDQYLATVTPRGSTEGALNFSLPLFSTYHFDIVSNGTSVRSSQSGDSQGVSIVARSDDTWSCAPLPPPCSFTP